MMNQSPPPALQTRDCPRPQITATADSILPVVEVTSTEHIDISRVLTSTTTTRMATNTPADSEVEITTATTTTLEGGGSSSTCSPHRRYRLQRSERLHSGSDSPTPPKSAAHSHNRGGGGSGQYSSWEVLIRDSFGHIAWPIKFTSWELIDDGNQLKDSVPTSSSATELISRRGVFSRRHYGSVDQLPQSELEGVDSSCRRFRLENGESVAEKDEVFGSPSTPILENPEYQTRWYFKYFLGKLHQNYVGIDSEKHPYFLSIVSQDSGTKSMPLCRVILFRKQGTQKIALPYSPQQKLTVKQILSHFPSMEAAKTPKELYSADIQKDLLLLEEQEGSVNFKFGVIYMKSGQRMDDEMLSNEIASTNFEEFLGVIGERIRLKGWERYRGGLDVKGDMTGKYSVYTLYEGHEIMFHVSTLLPFSRDNRQQVERKRHIGNDIVNIVFIDEGDLSEFSPNCIKSQFTHIFAVVIKIQNAGYKLCMYCDDTVPPFGPTLPDPPEFKSLNNLREFLLVKLINGEKATFQTPTFAKKRERTLEMLIKDLYEEYMHDSKLNMLNRRAFSEVLYDAPKASKLKEDARQVEFVRIGQALKLEAIVRGDAPTSMASTVPSSVFKRPPWEPHCFYANFVHRGNIVGDSWGKDALFVATDEGMFLVREDQSHQMVFDRTFCIRQISVVEDHGIILIRGGSPSNKDGHRIHVFRLSDFSEDLVQSRSRIEVKNHRIDKTRGCHLFSLLKANDGHLKMGCVLGKKLLTFQWKHTAAWTSWCPNNDNDTVDGFVFLKDFNLHDTPSLLTIIEAPTAEKASETIYCTGFKNHFEVIYETTGKIVRIHEVEPSKRSHSQTQLIAVVDLCDGQDKELLLCYNHTCHFQKLNEENTSHEFDFNWNSSPQSVICAFPYVIAFTNETMEIRLLVNGNLVHMVTMGELKLITSKRDIFFVTTAPEFIPRLSRIKGLGQDHDDQSTRSNGGGETKNTEVTTNPKVFTKINDICDEKIMEIKSKMERIEAKSTQESLDSCGSQDSQDSLKAPDEDSHNEVLINEKDNLNRLMVTESEELPSIQRARSLQGKDNKHRDSFEEKHRQISKSNSCGENSITNSSGTPSSIPAKIQEPSVPPNSPKVKDVPVSPLTQGSPTRKSKPQRHPNDTEGSPAKVKPLRIYRIPLSNLMGQHHAHNHHTHHSNHLYNNFTNPANLQSGKIAEDQTEDSEAGNQRTEEEELLKLGIEN